MEAIKTDLVNESFDEDVSLDEKKSDINSLPKKKYDPMLDHSVEQWVDPELMSEEDWLAIRSNPPPFPYSYFQGRGALPHMAHEAFNQLKEVDVKKQIKHHPFIRINALSYPFPFNRFPISMLGKKMTFLADLEETYLADTLSDYANEPARIKSRVIESDKTAHDLWFKEADMVIKDAIQHREGKVHKITLRKSLWHLAPMAPRFRPSTARCFMQFFGATNILDPCSGWGDRLLGAMSLGIKYTGVDPNTALVAGYQQLIENLAPKKEDYLMINGPIQTSEPLIKDRAPYDFVFTSPPFFDREIYSEEDTQSMHQVNTVQYWLDTFMYPLLEICSRNMKVEGFMAISINDYAYHMNPRHQYCADMLQYAVDQLGMTYVGCLPFHGYRKSFQGREDRPEVSSPQPVWILQKKKEPLQKRTLEIQESSPKKKKKRLW